MASFLTTKTLFVSNNGLRHLFYRSGTSCCANTWWRTRRPTSGARSGSCCFTSAAQRKSTASWGIFNLSTATSRRSRRLSAARTCPTMTERWPFRTCPTTPCCNSLNTSKLVSMLQPQGISYFKSRVSLNGGTSMSLPRTCQKTKSQQTHKKWSNWLGSQWTLK